MKDSSTPTISIPIEPEDIPDYDHPKIEICVEHFDRLIGQVFKHSELLGLTDRQLTAYKSILRQMFWDWYNSFLPNPHGLADPSKQGRVAAGIEPNVTIGPSGASYTFISS